MKTEKDKAINFLNSYCKSIAKEKFNECSECNHFQYYIRSRNNLFKYEIDNNILPFCGKYLMYCDKDLKKVCDE